MKFRKAFTKEKIAHLAKTLKYSLYLIFHPFDGFWDLTHEKRGSKGAATIIMALVLFTQIWTLQYTKKPFVVVQWEYINMVMVLLPTVVLFSIWCISNWSLTTLMDGKGRLGEIYMGTAYAFTPYVIIHIPLIFASYVLTSEEYTYYNILSKFATIWVVILVLSAMMMIHDFSLGKAIASSLLTIVGALVIIFLIVMFFSLITQSFGYFVSIYKEVTFRFY